MTTPTASNGKCGPFRIFHQMVVPDYVSLSIIICIIFITKLSLSCEAFAFRTASTITTTTSCTTPTKLLSSYLTKQQLLRHVSTISSKTLLNALEGDSNDVITDNKKPDFDSKTLKLEMKKKKKFVVIGAGWAGWGAAKALCESGLRYSRSSSSSNVNDDGDDDDDLLADVTIIDTLFDPTGKTPYLSPTGKPVEAGTRGFWKDYPNINNMCAELGLLESNIFTEYTNSSFYSPDGLEATAPVFSNTQLPTFDTTYLPPFLSTLSGMKLPQLPSPIGQVLATFPLFERIPLQDRASMIGLLIAIVDCLGSNDEQVQEQYDRMTAHELFLRFGLSTRLVEDFIKPTLLVGLFKPPEELSALVVMELLYYYALAHVDSFDVRWIKNGTVSSSLIAPLASHLESKYKLKVLGGCRVGKISCTPNPTSSNDRILHARSIEYYNTKTGVVETINDIDGIVLALSSKGMKSVVENSPDLAQFIEFSNAASCTGIDVISVRLWLDRTIPTRTPANVFSRYDELRGAGGTFFMLDQFQSNSLHDLWGGMEPQGSVVACDFYNAGSLLSLPDIDVINILMKELLPSAVPAFADAIVVDSWIGKYPGAVSWFGPNTYNKRPPLDGAGIEKLPNIKCAGDWVRMGKREHGAKGLCQERAYVTGLEAANSLLESIVSSTSSSTTTTSPSPYKSHVVLPVREDEIQFRAAATLNQQVMKFLPRFWVR